MVPTDRSPKRPRVLTDDGMMAVDGNDDDEMRTTSMVNVALYLSVVDGSRGLFGIPLVLALPRVLRVDQLMGHIATSIGYVHLSVCILAVLFIM